MPFFLDGNPTQGEISEAINYLLGNSQLTTSTNVVNGQVTDAIGQVVSYLYKYIYVKYADSFDGTVNFSNTPTNRQYYGLRNDDSGTESTNPADYVWYQVVGGFSTNKFIFYSVTGGRRINIVVSLSAPSILYQADSGAAIDLDQISGSDGASFRICYAKSASFALASTPTTYQTSGPSGFPPYNTWGGAETWQATPPTLSVNEALFQSDGVYNPVSNLTTWNVPYLSNLRVGALSAISANLGTITAGSVNAITVSASTINTSDITSGSFPAISGTGMSGSGIHLYDDGRIGIGNSTSNVVWNNSGIYIQGNLQSSNYSAGSTGWQILNNGNAEFNGVVISRQLQIDTGTYTLPSDVTIGNPANLTLVSTIYVETNTLASAWSGTSKTMIALAGFGGTINANVINITTQPQNVQWGLSCDVVPITRWAGDAKIFLAIKFYGRLANYYQSGGVVTWQLFEVT